MIDLAEEFRLLAEDGLWEVCSCSACCERRKVAALALMVVEERRAYLFAYEEDWTMDTCLEGALAYLGINPSHYANVKERVKAANG